MNWIIFSTEEREHDITKISTLLDKYNVNTEVVHLSDTFLKSNVTKISKELVTKIYDLLFNATYIVIFAPDAVLYTPILMYVLGYAFGKQIPLFLSESSKQILYNQLVSKTVFYSDIDELVKKLKKNFPSYIAYKKKNDAHMKLFEEGIPFTPDCFSSHIAKNNLEHCELFYQAGMDVNDRDSAGTPMLCIAARAGRKAMIQWLLKKGADLNAVSQDRGYSALMDAVWKSNFDIAKILVDLGADVNHIAQDGQSILVLATGANNYRICELLYRHGANPLIKDKMGMSALDYARLFKRTKLVEIYEESIK